MLKKNTKQQKRSAWQALLQMYSNPGDSQRRMFPSCKLERKGAMSYVKVPIITDWNIASAGCGNATLLCIRTEWSLDNFDQNWAPRSWSEILAQESNAWNHVLAPRDIQLASFCHQSKHWIGQETVSSFSNILSCLLGRGLRLMATAVKGRGVICCFPTVFRLSLWLREAPNFSEL